MIFFEFKKLKNEEIFNELAKHTKNGGSGTTFIQNTVNSLIDNKLTDLYKIYCLDQDNLNLILNLLILYKTDVCGTQAKLKEMFNQKT